MAGAGARLEPGENLAVEQANGVDAGDRDDVRAAQPGLAADFPQHADHVAGRETGVGPGCISPVKRSTMPRSRAMAS